MLARPINPTKAQSQHLLRQYQHEKSIMVGEQNYKIHYYLFSHTLPHINSYIMVSKATSHLHTDVAPDKS